MRTVSGRARLGREGTPVSAVHIVLIPNHFGVTMRMVYLARCPFPPPSAIPQLPAFGGQVLCRSVWLAILEGRRHAPEYKYLTG